MSRIAVIVPVLNRPANARPLYESLVASSKDAYLVFVCSPLDTYQQQACSACPCETLIADWDSGPGDFARKSNLGYAMTDQPLILLAADDLRFQPGWLEAIEKIADEYDVGVIGTNDNANPQVKAGRHSTHPVVRRCYIDRYGGSVGEPGQVYHQGYDHNWVDCELVETAKARGCYAHAHDALVTHHHPLYDHRVKRDATYVKGNAREREDAALFRSRKHLWEQEIHA